MGHLSIRLKTLIEVENYLCFVKEVETHLKNGKIIRPPKYYNWNFLKRSQVYPGDPTLKSSQERGCHSNVIGGDEMMYSIYLVKKMMYNICDLFIGVEL